MSAALPLPSHRSLQERDTATLLLMQSKLEQRMATLKGYALDRAEAEYDEISVEIEHRLTHIAIDGATTRVKFDHVCGQVLAFDADNHDIGSRMGMGRDAWAARNELESLMIERAGQQ